MNFTPNISDIAIAVLPFVNMSSDSDNEYFSDGIAEEIINALSKIQELKVISRTSSFSFKGKNYTLAEIGKILNVSIILDGSVRLSGTSARITVQLIEAQNGFHFWSETFDRDFKNAFVVQDEISLIIADKLREHLGHFNLDDRLVDSYDIPFETYQKYLKGRFYLMKLDFANTLKAISIFEEIIKEFPEFPLPYLDINQGYTYMATMGIISSYEGFTQSQPFLLKAIELNEDIPETQLNLAWISCWQKWDLNQAYEHLNKALSLRPTDSMYLTMANFLTIEGKLDTAMIYVNKSLDLAPFSPVSVHYKGFLFYMMGQFDKAQQYFKRSLDLQPKLPFPIVYMGAIYLLSGQYEKGLSFFNNLEDEDNGYLTKLGGIAIAHSMMGNHKLAEEVILQLDSYLQTPSAGNALNFLILCHAQLNNLEKALEYIQIAIENRFPLVLLLPTEPLAKPLHELTSFKKSIAEILGNSNSQEPVRKYKQSLFSDEELIRYKDRLNALMEEDKLYINPELSLRLLAEYMNLPPNHMSQLLNEGFEKNFADFINSYRLEEFKSKLNTASVHHLTLLALAYDSGFNSKTVFNTYFKKKMGISPKAYWNKIKH